MQVLRSFSEKEFDHGVEVLADITDYLLTNTYMLWDWKAVEDAPEDYEEMRKAYMDTYVLPVSNKFCDKTIFKDMQDNIKLRAWHDIQHLRYGLDFSFPSEVEVVSRQVKELLEYVNKFTQDPVVRNLSAWILHGDGVGQQCYHKKHGCFPINQRAFVQDCVRYGVDAVVKTGIRY